MKTHESPATKPAHTPQVSIVGTRHFLTRVMVIEDAFGQQHDFAEVTGQNEAESEAYAQLIRRAVNSHAELVAALEAVVNSGPLNNGLHDENTMDLARAALARAKA